jgi:hypothetical protein
VSIIRRVQNQYRRYQTEDHHNLKAATLGSVIWFEDGASLCSFRWSIVGGSVLVVAFLEEYIADLRRQCSAPRHHRCLVMRPVVRPITGRSLWRNATFLPGGDRPHDVVPCLAALGNPSRSRGPSSGRRSGSAPDREAAPRRPRGAELIKKSHFPHESPQHTTCVRLDLNW